MVSKVSSGVFFYMYLLQTNVVTCRHCFVIANKINGVKKNTVRKNLSPAACCVHCLREQSFGGQCKTHGKARASLAWRGSISMYIWGMCGLSLGRGSEFLDLKWLSAGCVGSSWKTPLKRLPQSWEDCAATSAKVGCYLLQKIWTISHGV